MCHCSDCQRRTGSAFSVAVFFPRDAVTIAAGVAHAFTRDSASGIPVTCRFCPDCGASVFWEAARMPDRIGVALGAFADPGFAAPIQLVFTRDKHHWVDLPPDMARFETFPPPR